VRLPVMEVRLAGRAISLRETGRASSARLSGRSGRMKLVALARLLGLLLSLFSLICRVSIVPKARLLGRLLSLFSLLSRFSTGPKDNRLIPDVDNLGTCFPEGVSSAPSPPSEDPLAVLPVFLFLLLIVTLGGM
jgi:hypothetical protein